MHYLVIEHFRSGDPVPVYQRFRAQGRLMPDGLESVSSWITEDLTRCYQVMKTEDRRGPGTAGSKARSAMKASSR
jgi:hypothetical protein